LKKKQLFDDTIVPKLYMKEDEKDKNNPKAKVLMTLDQIK
jgi:hypothetical protein